jgi:hypothetical protein
MQIATAKSTYDGDAFAAVPMLACIMQLTSSRKLGAFDRDAACCFYRVAATRSSVGPETVGQLPSVTAAAAVGRWLPAESFSITTDTPAGNAVW